MSSLPNHGGSDISNLLMSSSSRAIGASSEALDFQTPAPFGAHAIGSQGINSRQFEASRYLLPQDRALSKEIAFELLTQGLFRSVWIICTVVRAWIVDYFSAKTLPFRSLPYLSHTQSLFSSSNLSFFSRFLLTRVYRSDCTLPCLGQPHRQTGGFLFCDREADYSSQCRRQRP